MAARTRIELAPSVLEAFRRGEDDGVRAVYDNYSGPVYAVAWSVLGDRELAAEAVQETFVRAWRAAARYDPNQDLAPWLYTIARRVSVDLWRARRRTAATNIEDEVVVAFSPELDSVWEAYQVRAAVERLPVEEQDVVRLYHFEQLTHAEIADRLRIPLGTVKSRSHRAHRRLADWLRPLCTVTSDSSGAAPEPSGPPAAYPQYTDPGARHDEL
jgi:RNA polymerase sigma-70 factor, ECF subfamily